MEKFVIIHYYYEQKSFVSENKVWGKEFVRLPIRIIKERRKKKSVDHCRDHKSK